MSRRVSCPSCNASFDIDKAGLPRSVEQHRRFFGIVTAAYEHWPEAHPVQFSDATECRKWLTMKAGERDLAARIPLTGVKPEMAVMLATAAMRAAGSHAVAVAHKSELCIWTPRSLRFDRMGHLTFCKLNNDVAEVIRAETGLEPEQLLPERAA